LIAWCKKFFAAEFGGAKPADCGTFHGEFAAITISWAWQTSHLQVQMQEWVTKNRGFVIAHIIRL
jgi:hypothetical protein